MPTNSKFLCFQILIAILGLDSWWKLFSYHVNDLNSSGYTAWPLQCKVLLMSSEITIQTMLKPQSQLPRNERSPYQKNRGGPPLCSINLVFPLENLVAFFINWLFFHRLVKTNFLKLGYAMTLVHLTRSDCLFLTKFFPTVKRYF